MIFDDIEVLVIIWSMKLFWSVGLLVLLFGLLAFLETLATKLAGRLIGWKRIYHALRDQEARRRAEEGTP